MAPKAKKKDKREEEKGDLALFGPLVAVKQHGGAWVSTLPCFLSCVSAFLTAVLTCDEEPQDHQLTSLGATCPGRAHDAVPRQDIPGNGRGAASEAHAGAVKVAGERLDQD